MFSTNQKNDSAIKTCFLFCCSVPCWITYILHMAIILFYFILFIYLFFIFIYLFLFLAKLGHDCYAGFSLVSEGGGCSLAAVHGLLIATAPLVEHRLQGVQASGAATCGHSRGSPWALLQRSKGSRVFRPQELQPVGAAEGVPGLYRRGAIVVCTRLVALLQ